MLFKSPGILYISSNMKNVKSSLVIAIAVGLTSINLEAQRKSRKPVTVNYDQKYFSGMKYRSVGPSRGGRSTAVVGVEQKPFTFFMGATGGGVWKTDDAGASWNNISDGQIGTGSIGALAVSKSDHNVIYLGTGSASPRGNVSSGVGLYKSTDFGKTWKFSGLKNAGQIGDVVIHPNDPDIAYVAALGNIFGPNNERGVFKTTNGGASWSTTLFISNQTGIVDLSINPENPRVIYAAAWRAERKPWTMIDGGEEGGVYRSRDGGETWEKLEGGLPSGLLGRIGVEVSPANPDRVWALIQAKEEDDGGLYRSEDGGDTWKRINGDHLHRQRGWYYTHITADPIDENTIYSSNTGFYRSVDGGEKFERIRTPHGDNHGVWINPNNPDIMINCNDGGANVTLNGGKTWSTQENQPTAEFYRVTVDNQFPYRLYAGQQDNTTISVPSKRLPSITNTQHWEAIGGGESGDVAVHPTDPDIVYAGTYSGEITYVNRRTGQRLQMTAYPHYTEGTEQRDLKYRWQWNFPIFVSQHNPDELYMASNVVHRSRDRGQNWEVISSDLTNSIDAYHDIPGGPIQHDGTGVEIYSTIFALEESPQNAGELWAGSDDGRIHLTRDAGKTWTEITPAQMPKEGTVNKIELSTHEAGRAFTVIYRYRDNDPKPYIFRTNDYGSTWQMISSNNGIPSNHFVRSIAEDPDRKGLLYAGTEFGMYISFDDGVSWQSFQMNLPVVPITDLEVKDKDLVLSTQGRSFWVLDDLTPLHQVSTSMMAKDKFLYSPKETVRTNVGGWGGLKASINFYFEEMPEDTVRLTITDQSGSTVREWSSKPKEGEEQLKVEIGFNQLAWDQTHSSADMVENFVAMDFSHDNVPGSKAVPGNYQIKLSVGDWSENAELIIKPDPRWPDVTISDYQAKFDLEQQVISLIEESQGVIRSIRSIREQANNLAGLAEKAQLSSSLRKSAEELDEKLSEIEATLIQNKILTTQDEINFPRVFSNHIVRLFRVIVNEHNKPTGGMLERFEDLKNQFAKLKEPYNNLLSNDLLTFNKLAESSGVGKIILVAQ